MGVQPPGQWGPGQPQGQWGPGQPQGQWGPPPQRRNNWPIALLLLLLLLGGGGAAWFFLQKDDSGSGSTALAEGEVFMEPAAAVGPDPFSAQPLAPPPDPLIAQPALRQATRVAAPAQSAVQASSGAQPGLYGGTQNNAACDKAQMIAFLGANPDKAAAWVAAQNADPTLRWSGLPETGTRGRYASTRLDGLAPLGSILAPLVHLADPRRDVLQARALTVADIPAYIGTLTPLVLTADTRVTNHSFVAGQAPPRQAVLQKGSAVLVDVYGVPRARCYCGNPLLPPVPSKVQVTYVGNSWPDFEPGSVGVVSPAQQPVTSFQVRMPDGSIQTITAGGTAPAATAVAGAPSPGSASGSQPAATAMAGVGNHVPPTPAGPTAVTSNCATKWTQTREIASPRITIKGTAAVSAAAMDSAKHIYETMTAAFKPAYPKSTFDGYTVYITNGEPWSELSCLDPVGPMWPGTMEGVPKGDFLRGGASNDYAWISEQMICKRGVKTRNAAHAAGLSPSPDNNLRTFDQVVHEFAHSIQFRYGLDSRVQSVFARAPGGPNEAFAWAVQAWYGVPAQPLAPPAEAFLTEIFGSRATFDCATLYGSAPATETVPATVAVPPTPEPPTAAPTAAQPPTAAAPPTATPCTGSAQTSRGQVSVTFANTMSEPVRYVYVSSAASGCSEGGGGTLQPGESQSGNVTPGDLFRAYTLSGSHIKDFRVPDGGGTFNIGP